MIVLWIVIAILMFILNIGCIWLVVEMIKDRIVIGAITLSMMEAAWFLLTYLYVKNVFLSYGVTL